MSARQANQIGELIARETARASLSVRNPRERPALDAQYLVSVMMGSAATDPRRSGMLARPGASLGLEANELEMVAHALGRVGAPLTSHEVASAPDHVLEMATGRSGVDLLHLRLEAIGLRPTAGSSTPETVGRKYNTPKRRK
jgi:hypothetical protein